MSKLGADLDAEDAEIRQKRLEEEEKGREEELGALRTEIEQQGAKMGTLQVTQENSQSRILQVSIRYMMDIKEACCSSSLVVGV